MYNLEYTIRSVFVKLFPMHGCVLHYCSEVGQNHDSGAPGRLLPFHWPGMRILPFQAHALRCLMPEGEFTHKKGLDLFLSAGNDRNRGFGLPLNSSHPRLPQQVLFAKAFGCTRFVYNTLLEEKKKHYEKPPLQMRSIKWWEYVPFHRPSQIYKRVNSLQ